METKSSSATGRSSPLSEANRSLSAPMYSSTWSGVTSASSTVTGIPSRSGMSNFGRTSTSAVNVSSLPSSSFVTSRSGWPSAKTSCSSSALPYSFGTASFTACSSTVPRPNRWSITRGGMRPGRKPGTRTCRATSRYAWSRSDLSSSNGTSMVSRTLVGLTIEVPFEELKSDLDQAYREVARQVRVPGFRPGRIPPRVIDQRFGRGTVLEQAVNDAVPKLYGKALEEHEVFALGQPDLEVTKLDDGKELTFTAEVDVRPKFDIPDLDGMPVTVDDADVTPDQVEEYIGALSERFASLKGDDRPVADDDFVSIDLAASVDGEPVDDAQASGISYEVGTGSMLDGLDDALLGMAQGETKTFTAELGGGKLAGMQSDVTVTVHSVKVKEL